MSYSPHFSFDFLSVGSAVKDIFLFLKSEDSLIIKNPQRDVTRKRLLALEYGAKLDARETYLTFGGGAANSSTTFARLGFRAAVAVAVGQDSAGIDVANSLRREKIDTRFVTKDKNAPTGLSIIIAPEQGGDHTVLVERGAGTSLSPSRQALLGANAIYLTALSGDWQLVLNKIIRSVSVGKKKLVWNPGSEQIESGLGALGKYLKYCSVFIVNRDEALALVAKDKSSREVDNPRELLRQILAWGPDIAVITDGEKGVWCGSDNEGYFMSANREVRPIECTGAGDGFGSGFTAGLSMTGWQNIPLALDLGIANAESVIGKIGSGEGILRKKDLDKVLKKNRHKLRRL